jgi:hypothetical protein
MGVYQAFGPCVLCGVPFFFHPNKVPSLRLHGVREPVCRSCFDRANALRESKGLPPFTMIAGAYDPADESELDGDE